MAKRKPRVIWRGKPLKISARVQDKYFAQIMPHVERMIKEVRRDVEKLFKEDFAHEHFTADTVGMDASISSQTRILVNAFKKRYDQLFGSIALDVSGKMADNVNRNSYAGSQANLKDVPKDLKEQSKRLALDVKKLDKRSTQILRNSANRSADFIKTIPEHYLNKVANALYDSVTTGNGLQDLIPFFEKHDTGTKNWVHNTAMDQTRKLYSGLNKGRMQSAGISQGEWLHSGGSQHPRELHEDFDGQIFNLAEGAPVGDEDGDMVDPGEEPNCRCSFTPVITDDPPEDDEKNPDLEEDDEE